MKIWKRNAVLSAIILFVCVALYISWSYGTEPEQPDGGEQVNALEPKVGEFQTDEPAVLSAEEQFASLRIDRQKTRDNALAIFNYESGRADVSAEDKTKMLEQIQVLGKNAIDEAGIETVIKAKGFADCVAVIGNDGIEVIVATPDGGFTEADIAKITDAVVTNSAFPASKLTISPAATLE